MEVILATFGVLITLCLLRFIYLASKCGKGVPLSDKKRTTPCKSLIVLGSGGHTAEMLRLLGGINLANYSPRVYIIAEGDKMSEEKVRKFELEASRRGTDTSPTSSTGSNSLTEQQPVFNICRVPRARKVMQSYVTSVFSTLLAIFYTLPLVVRAWPDLVLCNGPGTCIPVCFWAYVVKFLGVKRLRIIYVESVCRVEHLSLSGVLLYRLFMSDDVFVQWPQLKQTYPRTTYIGRIV